MYVTTPPTKAGKNNGYRQTNARTVYIIKYCILFFLTDPSKSGIKKGPLKDPFFCHKNTRPNTLNKRFDGWLFCKKNWEKGSK